MFNNNLKYSGYNYKCEGYSEYDYKDLLKVVFMV